MNRTIAAIAKFFADGLFPDDGYEFTKRQRIDCEVSYRQHIKEIVLVGGVPFINPHTNKRFDFAKLSKLPDAEFPDDGLISHENLYRCLKDDDHVRGVYAPVSKAPKPISPISGGGFAGPECDSQSDTAEVKSLSEMTVDKRPLVHIDTTQDAPAKPLPKLREQEKQILEWLRKNNHDAKNLPRVKNGRSTVKAAARVALNGEGVFVAQTAFTKAWDRLRSGKEIKEIEASNNPTPHK